MAQVISDEDREETLLQIEELAQGYQYQYGGCGQSLLLALQRKLDLPGGPAALKATSYAGLGIARSGDMCGALFGAIVTMGLASGRENIKDPPYPEPEVIDETTGNPKSLETVRRFYQRFVDTFGSYRCRDIQVKYYGRSFDLGNPEEFKKFHEMSHDQCSKTVGKAARMAAETILAMPRR